MKTESTFKAFRVEEHEGTFNTAIKDMPFKPLETGDLLIKVHYSSINYKDALSASGNKGVTRQYPHTPGVDAVGTVVTSKSDLFKADEKVIVTSYDLGMNTDGGFAEYIKVPAAWAVKLPENLSMKEAMILGTAGLTAGMSVLRLTQLVKPKDGTIIVSGATGGVGALSVSILSKLGYDVAAITGKETETNYLTHMGAKSIIKRSDFEALDNKPLLKPQFAGGIDTVGGVILENIIKTTNHMGVVTSCGNVASPKLNLTVFPFILRGVTLVGIDSQNYPMHFREEVWNKLASDWKPSTLSETCNEITLNELDKNMALILKGQLKGRTVVAL
ncbi:putative YhdH/YhfP family quinone oxidoreductase [Mariniflexile fucanivorans]|uniref:Putative YhdH/YhfP family quinone oxidoreductase n=1 Tax=Mariniflexile fucanivorans TaxID=264023 RepID=A0A4R1RAM4_9FLAO|nr:YhdH/YhfP family quinone oxidoreductase [Mariniflexile fucanivorans]TCL62813.1 putative YhdH/YhfP family quinone oxidoreductase [Mariniflexile fucanivorans]